MNNITAYTILVAVALIISIIGYIDVKKNKNNSDKRLADLIARDMERNTRATIPSAYQETPESSRTEEKVEARVEYDKNQKRKVTIRKRG